MIRIGTLCYVVPSCLASPATGKAVGKIVEVASPPYEAPDASYLPGTYYDVLFEGWTFFCRSDKLVPISDPGADVGDWADAFGPQVEPAPAASQRTSVDLPNRLSMSSTATSAV